MTDYGLSDAQKLRRVENERDSYRNQLAAAQRKIDELQAAPKDREVKAS